MQAGLPLVFPTRVGMNRLDLGQEQVSERVPHTRGDEPAALTVIFQVPDVFPTRVGMNRVEWAGTSARTRVPHTRGDEPRTTKIISHLNLCSPHAWG